MLVQNTPVFISSKPQHKKKKKQISQRYPELSGLPIIGLQLVFSTKAQQR